MWSWHANGESSLNSSNLSVLAPPFTGPPFANPNSTLNMESSSDPSLGLPPLKSLLTLNEPVYGPEWLPNSVYRDLDPVNWSSQNPYSSSYPYDRISDSSRTNFSEIRPYYHPQYYFSEHGSVIPSAFPNQPSCDGLSSSQGGITSGSPYHDKTNVLSILSREKFSESTCTEGHDSAPYEGTMRRGDDEFTHKDYANHGAHSFIRDFSASLEASNNITLRRLLNPGDGNNIDSITTASPAKSNVESISMLPEAHSSRPPLDLSLEALARNYAIGYSHVPEKRSRLNVSVNLAPELSIGPPGSSPIDFLAKPSHDRVSAKEYLDSTNLPNTRLSLTTEVGFDRGKSEIGFDNVSEGFNHCNTTVESPCWKAHEHEEGSDMGRETNDAVNIGLYDVPYRCAGHVLSSPPSSYGEETVPRTDIHVLVKALHTLSKVILLSNDASSDLKEQDYEFLKDAANNVEACFLKGSPVLVKETSEHQKNGSVEGQSDAMCNCEKHQILLQEDGSFNPSSSDKDDKMTQAIKKILMENFHDEEEGPPCMFKNLWLEAEAALCSVNYKARYNLVKLQMRKSNLQNDKDSSTNRGFTDTANVEDLNQEGSDDLIIAESKKESRRFGAADLLKHSLDSIIGNVGPDTESSSSVMERFAVLKQRRMESDETLQSCLQPDNSDSYLERSLITHDSPNVGRSINRQPDKMETSVLARFPVLKQDYFPATTSDSVLLPQNEEDFIGDEFLQPESSSDGAPLEWEHVEKEEIEG